MSRINAALIGSGNIGTDLMYKALRSRSIDPVWMVGIDPASDGLKRRASRASRPRPQASTACCRIWRPTASEIAFDATSAYVHAENARKLQARAS